MIRSIYWRLKRELGILRGTEPRVRREISLPHSYHGTVYGGWSLHPGILSENPIIYSAGVGEDISFDLSVIEEYNARVFAIDPTPRSREWVDSQDIPESFTFLPYGLADYDGVARFFPPKNPDHVSHSLIAGDRDPIGVEVRRVSTIMEELGHSEIDVIKLDIEGAEYKVLTDMLRFGLCIPQVLVEFHHRFDEIEVDKTEKAVAKMREGGYRISHISPNGEEYVFICKGSLEAGL